MIARAKRGGKARDDKGIVTLTCDTGLFHIHQVRLEHALGSFVSLRSDLDDPSIRELASAQCRHLKPQLTV